mmetsp:Transcript_38317/g.102920  ORF Transcript_38317/g.102920 Transcript_38317/m.102920 type:complete len:209 (+) Transcript_38317:268-894(+)
MQRGPPEHRAAIAGGHRPDEQKHPAAPGILHRPVRRGLPEAAALPPLPDVRPRGAVDLRRPRGGVQAVAGLRVRAPAPLLLPLPQEVGHDVGRVQPPQDGLQGSWNPATPQVREGRRGGPRDGLRRLGGVHPLGLGGRAAAPDRVPGLQGVRRHAPGDARHDGSPGAPEGAAAGHQVGGGVWPGAAASARSLGAAGRGCRCLEGATPA